MDLSNVLHTEDDSTFSYAADLPLPYFPSSNKTALSGSGPEAVDLDPFAFEANQQAPSPVPEQPGSSPTAAYLMPASTQDRRLPTSPAPIPERNTSVPSSPAGNKKRYSFTGPELLQLASVAAEINPWAAPHGQKMKRWERVAELVKGHNSAFKKYKRSAQTYKAKMEALISWHTDYDSHPTNAALIDREIIRGRDVRISISAVLDKAASVRVTAATLSEEAKENARVVQEENAAGGAVIRASAMTTLGRRRRSSSTGDDGSDKENSSPTVRPKKKRICSSQEPTNLNRIEELLVKQEERRQNHDNSVLEEYRAANQATRDFQTSLLNAIKNMN